MSCFFSNGTATTEIYTLSYTTLFRSYAGEKHGGVKPANFLDIGGGANAQVMADGLDVILNDKDRKSTRLNSSHSSISYAVFCLKKKILYRFPYIRKYHNSTFSLHNPN